MNLMDHLWLDQRAQRAPERVPVLGDVCFDGSEFSHFPQRCGYQHDELKSAAFIPKVVAPMSLGQSLTAPQRRALSAIQEWLFFGIIAETANVLGFSVQREELVECDTKGFWLCTKNLPSILQRGLDPVLNKCFSKKWDHPDAAQLISNISGYSTHKRDELQYRYQELTMLDRLRIHSSISSGETKGLGQSLQRLSATSRRFLRSALSFTGEDELDELSLGIWLSSYLLAETISELAEEAFNVMRERVRFKIDHFWYRRALANTLCPSKVFREVDTITDMYLATSAVSNDEFQHTSCQYGRWANASVNCKHVGDVGGLPHHARHCPGGCAMIDIDTEASREVKSSLNNDSYPVCHIAGSGSKSYDLQVAYYAEHNQDYVAFSHVW